MSDHAFLTGLFEMDINRVSLRLFEWWVEKCEVSLANKTLAHRVQVLGNYLGISVKRHGLINSLGVEDTHIIDLLNCPALEIL